VDDRHVEAEAPVQLGAHDVGEGARGIGAEAGPVLLREVDELRDGLRARRLLGHQRQVPGGHDGEEGEVLVRVVGQVPEHHPVAEHGRGDGDHQGVAVVRRRLQRLGGDAAAGPDPVLDHHGLAARLLDVVAIGAGVAVGDAAGREGAEDPHWPVRPGALGAQQGRSRHGGGGGQHEAPAGEAVAHGVPSGSFLPGFARWGLSGARMRILSRLRDAVKSRRNTVSLQ
jgi:hypothetical protein